MTYPTDAERLNRLFERGERPRCNSCVFFGWNLRHDGDGVPWSLCKRSHVDQRPKNVDDWCGEWARKLGMASEANPDARNG